jgi:hypothetical protein
MSKFIEKTSKYRCPICHKDYNNPLVADSCERSHSLIYIAVKKTDLMSLIQFIYNPDIKLLDQKFVEQLIKYSRLKETTSEFGADDNNDLSEV